MGSDFNSSEDSDFIQKMPWTQSKIDGVFEDDLSVVSNWFEDSKRQMESNEGLSQFDNGTPKMNNS